MSFRQREYERAFGAFIEQVIEGFIALDPVLSRVQRRRTSGPLSVGPSDGPAGEERMVGGGDAVDVQLILDVDVGSFQASIGAVALEYVEGMRAMVIEGVTANAEAAGNVIDNGGRPLDWDVVLDALERTPWAADERGVVGAPQVVMRSGRPADLGERTFDQELRFRLLQARKQADHDVGRRSRRIP